MAAFAVNGYRRCVSVFKDSGNDGTALGAPWSLEEYLRWQREQEEREERDREAANLIILVRFDPECEAAVRALEESGWRCQARSRGGR